MSGGAVAGASGAGPGSAPGEPSAGPPDVWVALCTAPDLATAERLARLAVEGGHAACANLLQGVRSIFRWRGVVEDATEVLLVFKTTSAAYPGLARLVTAEHPYEVPELVALPLRSGLDAYLAWVRAESAPVDRGRAGV
ncbi:MAG: divalent-cation tolerance protein CutA [Gemmatimonadota bacterium]